MSEVLRKYRASGWFGWIRGELRSDCQGSVESHGDLKTKLLEATLMSEKSFSYITERKRKVNKDNEVF